MTDVALGIDLGTGSTKAALLDADGHLLAVTRAPHEIRAPDVTTAESDPAAWIVSVCRAVRELLASDTSRRVVTVGLSGQMHGVVCTTATGQATYPAVLWSDRRAARWIEDHVGRLDPSLLTALVNPVTAGMAGPILATLQQQEADAWSRARWFLQPKDWLRLWLTGVAATDPSDASATLLWDVGQDHWSEGAAEVFGVPIDRLPPVRPSGSTAGALTSAAADELGLPGGLPVAIGAADTAAALLGAGIAPGATQVTVGTGGQIARVLATPMADPTRRTHLYRAAEPDRWYAMAAVQNAGIAIDWAHTVLLAGPQEIEAALAAPAADSSVVFLPYLTGERTPHLDAGLTGRWVGLTPSVTRLDLLRAVYEGVAYALRDGLDALRAAGHDIERADLAGGGTRDPAWQRLLTDALAIPLRVCAVTDASVRGAAILGWRALGHQVVDPPESAPTPELRPRPDAHDGLRRFHRAVVAATSTSSSTQS